MDRKATYTVLKTLIQTLNRDFSTNLDTEKILANCWAADKTGIADSDTDMEAEVPPREQTHSASGGEQPEKTGTAAKRIRLYRNRSLACVMDGNTGKYFGN
jgi:hypothetical protein